jgi:LPXTG-motif cell wall-anchored protein
MAMLDAQTKKSEEVVIKSDETKTGMSTTTKVLIGVGVLALIGGVIYFVRRGASAK